MSENAGELAPRYCHSLPGLNRLLEVTRVLAVEIDLAKILETIAAEACHGLHCEKAIVYQFDAKRNVLFATAGTSHQLIVSLGKGIPGWVATRREMLNLAEPLGDPRWEDAYDRASGFRTQTVLATPLIA